MKVDLNLLMRGDEYVPQVGTEYEVAPGVWGKMKAPTIAFHQEVVAKAKEEEYKDFELMLMVLDGVGDVKEEDCIPGMASQAVYDFFSFVTRMYERLRNSSAASGQEETQKSG